MKKLILLVAAIMVAVVTNAAAVAWTAAGMKTYAGDTVNLFIIGQNGVENMATVTALLDAGKSVDSYVFGSSTVGSTGTGNGNATGTLGEGTYTAFLVLFDDGKYVTISGQSNMTQSVGPSTAKVTFGAANVSSIVNTASNWKSMGGTPTDPTPEPTSGLLLLVGAGMLALRRKQK